jgi:hypothetical protein
MIDTYMKSLILAFPVVIHPNDTCYVHPATAVSSGCDAHLSAASLDCHCYLTAGCTFVGNFKQDQ